MGRVRSVIYRWRAADSLRAIVGDIATAEILAYIRHLSAPGFDACQTEHLRLRLPIQSDVVFHRLVALDDITSHHVGSFLAHL